MLGRFFSGKRPTDLGVDQGRLKACPSSPNCVCSQARDKQHYIAPLESSGSQGSALIEQIAKVLASWAHTEIITLHKNYLHAECHSAVFGFVDDLECYWNQHEQVCHIRSASRLGKSDLGKNRKRVETLRRALES